jgi:hypothetical protein
VYIPEQRKNRTLVCSTMRSSRQEQRKGTQVQQGTL